MNPVISFTYAPAKGLWMTASTAARRSGTVDTGPPSWKISSTAVNFFRT